MVHVPSGRALGPLVLRAASRDHRLEPRDRRAHRAVGEAARGDREHSGVGSRGEGDVRVGRHIGHLPAVHRAARDRHVRVGARRAAVRAIPDARHVRHDRQPVHADAAALHSGGRLLHNDPRVPATDRPPVPAGDALRRQVRLRCAQHGAREQQLPSRQPAGRRH